MQSRRAFLAAAAVPLLRGQNNTRMFADAEAYERFMGRWSRLVAPLLLNFAGIRPGGQVLDVGSGTGALAFAIAERDPTARVVGIDPSKEYVAYAASKSPFPNRTRFEVGDAQDLHLPKASFRASVALLVFNFIPDPRKALDQVRSVTEAGGVIAAAVWDYGDGMRMLRAFWDAAVSVDPRVEPRDEKHMRLCRSGELSRLWKEAGLEKVREQALEVTTRFASFDDYWNAFLLGQGPAGSYTRTLDAAHLRALRDAVKRRLAISVESAAFDLPARVWAVRGTVPLRDG
ncbi:MAG TPA: methyltransferase domain-containing protein [Candidatus Acidoferrum sp.]|nr:methyltransferase domain-containing protein [Candidatus Acidoferrum sp.]